MNWVVWLDDGAVRFGALSGDMVQPHRGWIFGEPEPEGAALPLGSLRLVSPVRPTQFIGLWNNFHALAEKQGNAKPDFPLYFLN